MATPYSFGVAGIGMMPGPLPLAVGEAAADPNQFYPALPGFTVYEEAPPRAAEQPRQIFLGAFTGFGASGPRTISPTDYAAHAAARARIQTLPGPRGWTGGAAGPNLQGSIRPHDRGYTQKGPVVPV